MYLHCRWCFECAWEVGNKVGGIYTVIRSKTGVSTNELGDQGFERYSDIDHLAHWHSQFCPVLICPSRAGQVVE